jgi:hypothetical protein
VPQRRSISRPPGKPTEILEDMHPLTEDCVDGRVRHRGAVDAGDGTRALVSALGLERGIGSWQEAIKLEPALLNLLGGFEAE